MASAQPGAQPPGHGSGSVTIEASGKVTVVAGPELVTALDAVGMLLKDDKIVVPPLGFSERVLPNGLKVYTARDTSTSNVTVQVWYRVGGKDDPPRRSGFAHLFEQLLTGRCRAEGGQQRMPGQLVQAPAFDAQVAVEFAAFVDQSCVDDEGVGHR